jgi:hypothetical protein
MGLLHDTCKWFGHKKTGQALFLYRNADNAYSPDAAFGALLLE